MINSLEVRYYSENICVEFFSVGEKKDKGLKFNQLPLDANGAYEIAVRRGRGQNNIETNKNTCSNYKEVL